MKKVVLLAFVLFSLCVVGLLRLQITYASPYTDIDVATAYNMITNGSYPNLVVLDVRTKSEYDSGHIYGAVWIPHTELEARIGELAGHENHEIIVYCRSGVRSVNASEILDSHSFTKVYNMLEGILEWQSAGYPVWIATVHNVNTTFNYDTIQVAIDAPQTLYGHTILVDAGTYYEHVVVKKSISLIGENRSTTVIDGNGTGNVILIYLTTHHVNITGFTIRNGTNGILIHWSDYNIISGNIVTDNQNGIHLFSTCPCNPANKNTIRNNIIKNNGVGISLGVSIGNIIYHNNFINNTQQVYIQTSGYANIWDDGYPSGGNYWSNYTGVDSDHDGIGDPPHIIDGNNTDNCPLMGMFHSFNASPGYNVNVISNSTVEDFTFFESNSTIRMYVSNSSATQSFGFCRVCIPKGLMSSPYTVIIDDGLTNVLYFNGTVYDNDTHIWIYFAYEHSTHKVDIIPEFPTWTSMLLILIVLTVAIAIYKRRLLKTPIH